MGDGDEEVLSTGRPPVLKRRLRGDIAVAIVVLGGAYLIARAVSHGHPTHGGIPTTTPTSSGSSSVSLTGPPPRGVFTFGPREAGLETLVSATPCRRAQAGRSVSCVSTHAIPPAVAAAVHRAFPRLLIDDVDTTFLRPADARIWSRTISGHDRRTYLIAVVSRLGPSGTGAHSGVDPGETTFYIRTQHAPYAVQLEVIELSSAGPSLGTITKLANDPRLLQHG